MRRLYIEKPFITHIKANIKKREYENDNTKIILDKTIFMPKTYYYPKDEGTIDGKNIIDSYEKDDTIVYVIDGKPSKSEVELKLTKSLREKIMPYNAAIILIALAIEKFYNRKTFFFELKEDYCMISFDDITEDSVNIKALESFINYIVDLGLSINYEDDYYNISSLGKIKYFGISSTNTKAIDHIKIFKSEIENDTLILSFIVGEDYKKYVERNENTLKEIKKIAMNDEESTDKINKIINLVANERFLDKF
ncbi:MAG: hypothetical protein Q4B36_00840 [Tissierellia bacterium]|nr:hypothetical protein [Tissierellia bacterium]